MKKGLFGLLIFNLWPVLGHANTLETNWHHQFLETKKAQKNADNAATMVVAILDTGYDFAGQALPSYLWVNQEEIPNNNLDDDQNGYVDDVNGLNLIDKKSSPQDEQGDGTCLSSLIAAPYTSDEIPYGVAPQAKIMPIKISKNGETPQAQLIIQGISYAIRNGANLILLGSNLKTFSRPLDELLKTLERNELILFAPAGDEGKNIDQFPLFPANSKYWSVVTVAASDENSNLLETSNRGELSVTLAAPGKALSCVGIQNKVKQVDGSKFAAALGASAMALYKGHKPKKDFQSLIQDLYKSTFKRMSFFQKIQGAGELHVLSLIKGKENKSKLPFEKGNWNDWEQVIESPHPYYNKSRELEVLNRANTVWWKLVVDRLEFEPNYDSLSIRDPSTSSTLAKYSGYFRNGSELYFNRSQLEFIMESDESESEYGHRFHQIQYGVPK